MSSTKIKLPSVLTKDCWFYKENKDLCDPHLGKYYISYSSVDSWCEYREDFIKQKFAGLKLPTGLYGALGTYCGVAIEKGEFPENNPNNFTGQQNLDLDKLRPKGAEYEKMIIIDRGDYIILGFIDTYLNLNVGAHIQDTKTGGKDKESKYKGDDYIQVILYAHAIELTGVKVSKTDVYFIRRTGSHVNPPLNISTEQFVIPLEYTKERVDFALAKVDSVVSEISELYTFYSKYFN